MKEIHISVPICDSSLSSLLCPTSWRLLTFSVLVYTMIFLFLYIVMFDCLMVQPWCFPCRCVLQSECSRGNQPGQWLWSFVMEQQCLNIQDLNPSNVSRMESRMVRLTLSRKGAGHHQDADFCLLVASDFTLSSYRRFLITSRSYISCVLDPVLPLHVFKYHNSSPCALTVPYKQSWLVCCALAVSTVR